MRPADFWSLHPLEFWWIADARSPEVTRGMVGSMRLDKFDRLKGMLH